MQIEGDRTLPEPERAARDRRSDPSVRLSEQSAEELYEHAPCGYLSATPGGALVRVNATFLRWTGYAREDLVGVRRFQDLLTAGGRIYHETHYAPMLRMQGTVREIAVDIVCADGRRLPVLINSVLVTDDAGEPQMVRTTVFDATERKLYERELLELRNRERAAREQAERLAAQSGDVAHTLQQALLGSAPPDDPRYSVETLYQPAIEQLEVGGDWHDAFLLPSGRLGDRRRRRRRPRPARGHGDGPAAQRRARAGGRGLRPEGDRRAPRHVRRAGRGRAVRDAGLRGGRPGERRGRLRLRRPSPARC